MDELTFFQTAISPLAVIEGAHRLTVNPEQALQPSYVVIPLKNFDDSVQDLVLDVTSEFVSSFQIQKSYIDVLQMMFPPDYPITSSAWETLMLKRSSGVPELRDVSMEEGEPSAPCIVLNDEDYWVDILLQPCRCIGTTVMKFAETWVPMREIAGRSEVFLDDKLMIPSLVKLESRVATSQGFGDLYRKLITQKGISMRYRSITSSSDGESLTAAMKLAQRHAEETRSGTDGDSE
jgi:hypothetical protein